MMLGNRERKCKRELVGQEWRRMSTLIGLLTHWHKASFIRTPMGSDCLSPPILSKHIARATSRSHAISPRHFRERREFLVIWAWYQYPFWFIWEKTRGRRKGMCSCWMLLTWTMIYIPARGTIKFWILWRSCSEHKDTAALTVAGGPSKEPNTAGNTLHDLKPDLNSDLNVMTHFCRVCTGLHKMWQITLGTHYSVEGLALKSLASHLNVRLLRAILTILNMFRF